MINIFKISEIVDMGIEKEIKRRDFYALAAKRFPDGELKALFEKLRDWEETHVKKFSAIRGGLIDDEVAQDYPGELNEYMHVVINEQLYQIATITEFEKKIKGIEDAVRYGIEFEKDAILFFNELLMYI
jgi:rubrerythrin